MARKSETDLRRYDWTKAERGRYVGKARGSVERIVIETKAVAALGGAEAVREILRVLARAMSEKKRAPKKARRAA